MVYTPTSWTNGAAPAINSTNLNKIEAGIAGALPVSNIVAFGASTASSDNTSAIQAAFDHAAANGQVVFIPGGVFLTGKLTVPHGAHIMGVNTPVATGSFPTQISTLKLKNSVNDDVLYIPNTSSRTIIQDLTIDGNRANNTGAGHGIHFQSDVAANSTSAVLVRVRTQFCENDGIRVAGWRQGVKMLQVMSSDNNVHGIHMMATDSVIDAPTCGNNGGKGILVTGDTNIVRGAACWGNEVGITVGTGAKRVLLMGNGCDKNLQEGIEINATAAGVSVIGGMMTSNGIDADNTYSHIRVRTTTGKVTIVGVNFSDLEPGVTNNTDYAIGLDAGATANAWGNNYDGGSQGGFCNDDSRLYGNPPTPTPAVRSGVYVFTSPGSPNTGAPSDGSLALHEWHVPNTITVTRLGAEVTTVGNAGSLLRLGIYRDLSGYPGALVVDAGTIAGDSATVQEKTIAVTLEPGIYWVGGATQSAATTPPTFRTTSQAASGRHAAKSTIPTAGEVFSGIRLTGVTGALPNPFTAGAVTTSAVARTFIKTS